MGFCWRSSMLDFCRSKHCVVVTCFTLQLSDKIWSLIRYDVEHLFICLSSICISSLMRGLFIFFSHFKIRLFTFYCWVSRGLCIFQITVFIRCVFGKYFVSVCGFSSPSLDHQLFLANALGIGLFSWCGLWIRSDNEQPLNGAFQGVARQAK